MPMPRLGRIAAEGLMDRAQTAPRPVRRGVTIADRDRAILDLWDIDWPVDAIAAELGIGEHLVEQAIAIFGGNA